MVYLIFDFSFCFMFSMLPFPQCRHCVILVRGDGKLWFKCLEKKKRRIFFWKETKRFSICVILRSCTILNDIEASWLNTRFYISIACRIELSPKCVISCLSSKPIIWLLFRVQSIFIYCHCLRVLGFHCWVSHSFFILFAFSFSPKEIKKEKGKKDIKRKKKNSKLPK